MLLKKISTYTCTIIIIVFSCIFVKDGYSFSYEENVSGYLAFEGKWYPTDGRIEDHHHLYGSILFRPELNLKWEDGKQILTFIPYFRIDSYNDERMHTNSFNTHSEIKDKDLVFYDNDRYYADIRELFYLKAFHFGEVRIGIRKVFWGVIESIHLVDIINQTDNIASAFGQEKLGQPMLNIALNSFIGTFELFGMTGFRERNFYGREGRPYNFIDTTQADYESDKEVWNFDFACRYFRTIGSFELGLSYFHGTGREPFFLISSTTGMLVPRYEIINQYGIDLQWILGGVSLKFEGIYRESKTLSLWAAAFGLEYTFYQVLQSNNDLGIIIEYLYDSRKNTIKYFLENHTSSLYENDVFAGLRLSFNDMQSSAITMGVVFDVITHSPIYRVQGERRLGNSMKISLEMMIYGKSKNSDLMNNIKNDDFVRIIFAKYI